MKTNIAKRPVSTVAVCKIAAIVFLLAATVFYACGEASSKLTSDVFESYREIPGVTYDEIRAIEALRVKTPYFIYGMLSNTETFAKENGEIGGFAALFCEWLSRLFGIPFKPAIYEWGDLVAGLKSTKIDFTGEMTATDERRRVYFMTDAIAERLIKTFRLADSKPILEIIRSRPLRCCFLEGTTTISDVTLRLRDNCEIITVNDYNSAYQALESGQADAYFDENSAESAFDTYGGVISEDFLPIIYSPVSMATANPDLQPVISVMQKALENGVMSHLADLYSKGRRENRRHMFHMRLSEEEKAYISAHPVISFASEYDNYPISFYNKYEKEWQGIAHDVLEELEELTGLTFKITNAKNAEWPDLLNALERGEVSMISELLRTAEREGLFLWPQTAIMTDQYALISKYDRPRIHTNDILSISVGLIKNTAYTLSFRRWFPDHNNTVEYESTNTAFDALEHGKVDMVMASLNQLLMLTNYYERAGYKANIVFNFAFESTFGFNKNDTVICSIVDKALHLIDTKGISGHWTRKTYDYSTKLARLHKQWLIRAAVLLSFVLALLFILFRKTLRAEKRLETLVQKRTNELVIHSATITAAFDATPDMVFCKDLDSRFTRCNKAFEKYFNIRQEDIIGKGDVDGLGIPAEMSEHYREWDRKIVSDGRTVVVEEYIPSADGTSDLFETSKVPLV
jgi:ABC-type amino acid transport substrate-binding protein